MSHPFYSRQKRNRVLIQQCHCTPHSKTLHYSTLFFYFFLPKTIFLDYIVSFTKKQTFFLSI
jgi:hypothetical protein